MEGYQIGVRRARNALFWVAGIVLVSEVIFAIISKYELNIYGMAIVIAIAATFYGIRLLDEGKTVHGINPGANILYRLYRTDSCSQ